MILITGKSSFKIPRLRPCREPLAESSGSAGSIGADNDFIYQKYLGMGNTLLKELREAGVV